MEFLDRKCSDIVILELSQLITDWKTLAPYFNISKSEEREIAEDCKSNYVEQKRAFLHKWRQKNGNQATIRNLCLLLEKAGETGLIRMIELKYNASVVGMANYHPTADITIPKMSTSTDSPAVKESSSAVESSTPEVDPKIIKAILVKYRADIAAGIDNITDFSNRLVGKDLIDDDKADEIDSIMGISRLDKVTRLLKATEKVISKGEPLTRLKAFCEILNRYKATENIAREMIEKAGMENNSLPKKEASSSSKLQPLKSNNYNEFTVENYGSPKIKDLLHYASEVPDLWEDLGIQLEVPTAQLNAIRMKISNGGLPSKFFTDVFTYWENKNPLDAPYSWKTFLEALASPFINQVLLADRIAEDLRSRKTR